MPDPVKLLLVDDDRLVLATIGRGLEEAGFAVQTCASAEEALRVMAIETPDLAILDIRMPGLSGLDLAQDLRDRLGIPFIFLTAFGEPDLVTQAAERGALGYVVKPVDLPQLLPAVEAALARAAEIRSLRATGSQLQTALNENREVSIAIGIVMERHRMDRRQAFDTLRATARAQRRKLPEVAREFLAAAELLNSQR